MEYLTQNELKKMILLSYEKIEKEKEQINKINVFPVPDQDTGNNLAKTLLGIKEAIGGKEFKDLKEISGAALDGALNGAQGNAGVIYTGFLAGFFALLNKNPVDAQKLALAFAKGAERARQSIQDPKEGTILDVVDAVSRSFKENSEREKNIITIFEKAIEKAREALMNTREKMEIFKKANVVDAGGLGFLMILESYLEALEKEEKPAFAKATAGKEIPSEKIKKFVQILAHRYEIIALLENPRFDEKAIGEKLKKLGNSLDVVQVGNKMKIHFHTDYPNEVKEVLREIGRIQSLRIEDVTKEVAGEESVRKVSIGIVTDDGAMLLPKIVERYQIEVAHVKFDWPELEEIPGGNVYQKMREIQKKGIKTLPKTSQATPKSYLDAFEKQLERLDKVLCITISSKLSGCYNSAVQARGMAKTPERIFILDSLHVFASQALLVSRAIELIQEQREIGEIMTELKNLILRTHIDVLFDDPKWLESLGRITKSQADWIRRMKKIRINPLIKIQDGNLVKGGVVFAKDMAEALFKKISKESERERKMGRKIRVVIGHTDNLPQAEKLKQMLKEKIAAEILFINTGPPVVCVAIGPGALFAGWMPSE